MLMWTGQQVAAASADLLQLVLTSRSICSVRIGCIDASFIILFLL